MVLTFSIFQVLVMTVVYINTTCIESRISRVTMYKL